MPKGNSDTKGTAKAAVQKKQRTERKVVQKLDGDAKSAALSELRAKARSAKREGPAVVRAVNSTEDLRTCAELLPGLLEGTITVNDIAACISSTNPHFTLRRLLGESRAKWVDSFGGDYKAMWERVAEIQREHGVEVE